MYQHNLMCLTLSWRLWVTNPVTHQQRGGDIDLLIEPSHSLTKRIQIECQLAACLYIKLGSRKVDVLIKNPLEPILAIHEQALKNGVVL
jgi:uncharacterized protein